MFSSYSDVFNKYFRSIYLLYEYIYSSELITDKESIFYSKIISSQLSEYEMVIIFYYSMINNLGYPNFTWLIKFFNILEHLDTNLLLLGKDDYKFFTENLPTEIPEGLKVGRQKV